MRAGGLFTSSLFAGQARTLILLFCGYAALYFCRADLSVATPLLADDLGRQGFAHDQALIRIGSIASLGVLAYALGKLFLTGLGDLWGGRRNFLIGLGGATAFTVMFGLGSGVAWFTLAWLGNRLTQSLAWAGLLKVSSRWFDYSSHGRIIGVLSVSYLVGDAVARQWMGLLIQAGHSWRVLFFLAAAVAGVCFVSCLFLLRESRTEAGHAEATSNPLSVFAAHEPQPRKLRQLLQPLLHSRAFWLVCFLSLGCTIIRETFNIWTPVYLRDSLGYGVSEAARLSAIFPAVGAVSVLATGWLGDRLGPGGRSLLLFSGLGATALILLLLRYLPVAPGSPLPLLAIGGIAFCLLGPYSCLGGAIAVDFGGKQAAAFSSGIIDGVGYLGAVLAGDAVARLAVGFGWRGVFVALAGVSVVAAAGAGWLLADMLASARRVASR